MELTLNRNSMSQYQLIHHRTHSQEETQEAIVPDACPDILRVIQTSGKICLRGKQAREGIATATGMVAATVLYQPEGESVLRKIQVTLPFDCQITVPALTQQGEVVVTTQLKGIDARVLNPRKILLRCDIGVEVQGFMPQEQEFCHSITAEPSAGIQQAQRERDTYAIFAVQGKAFTFEEQVKCSGQGEMGEIILSRGLPSCTECKRIGNKLILKGEFSLQLLTQESSGGLALSEHSLPFSQILEVGGYSEAGDCETHLELVQLEIAPSQEGGRQLELRVELLAQVVVRGHSTVQLLEDVYSTGWEMETECTAHPITTLLDSATSTQNMRELLELEGTVRKLVDCWCSLGEVRQIREGGRLQLISDVHVMVLYLDEVGNLQSSVHTVPSGLWVDCPEGDCHCVCRCPQEIFATPAAGGVEVRLAVQFDYLLTQMEEISAIVGAQLTELRQRGEGYPSVVLRRGEAGETLWDLAKCYGTTRGEILAANELEDREDDSLPLGMLLIPSVRV